MTFFLVALAVTGILWTLLLVLAPPLSAMKAGANAFFPLLIFSVFAIIFSVKAHSGLPDRSVYTNELQYIAGHTLGEAFALTFHTAREPFYILFMWIVSLGGQTAAWLYFWVGTVGALTYVMAILTLVPSWQAPLVWLTTLALGFFTSYASLVARQGLSMAMLFAAICLILAGKRTRGWVILLAVSALVHWSAIPIALTIALLALVQVRLRVVLVAWGTAAMLFLTGVQARVLEPVAGLVPGLNGYVDPSLSSDYLGGVNRRDFLLFSIGILAIGLIALRRGVPVSWYRRLIVFYVTLNVYFLLFGFILYSDRLAVYSWILAPLILGTPFVYAKSTVGRMVTMAFVSVVVMYGIVFGPFRQMIGIQPY